ncbi:MAG: DUF2029 domain-containing protein [Clostridiales bacterium]|nr:DUF2029 domain-containing protein [Clostridiales bacterium]
MPRLKYRVKMKLIRSIRIVTLIYLGLFFIGMFIFSALHEPMPYSEELLKPSLVYSWICMPATGILSLLGISESYAFPYTNLICLVASLLLMNLILKNDYTRKLLLTIALTLNPIIFYMSWNSSDVLIYSLMILALSFWYTKGYKRGAILISLAAILNPSVLAVALIMFIEFLVDTIRSDKKAGRKVGGIALYISTHLLSLFPFVYNFTMTGEVDFTGGHELSFGGSESIFSRFGAYLFDLNFGILPYFVVLMGISVVLLVLAMYKYNIRYIAWFVAFLLHVFCYSLVVDINGVMSGIARFNVWGMTTLIFAVVLVGMDLPELVNTKIGYGISVMSGVLLTMIVVIAYGPFMADNTIYTSHTPLASFVTEHFPSLYSPLKSTFKSRTLHEEDTKTIDTPVVLYGNDAYVRKILATSDDKEKLLNEYVSYGESYEKFTTAVDGLTETPTYLNFSSKDKISRSVSYNKGASLNFSKTRSNGFQYFVKGLSEPEDWGAWIDGGEAVLRMRLSSINGKAHVTIKTKSNSKQDIIIYQDDEVVYKANSFRGDEISFDIKVSINEGPIELRIILPEATIPTKPGQEIDREDGFGITEIVIQ